MREILESNGIKILKGFIISCILTLLLLFIYAVILTYTEVEESTMRPVVILITAVSILIR